jgi:hypothetical protein
MAIISEQENFLLKFRQESSNSSFKPLDISVYKQEEKLVIEMRHEKRGSSIKVELDSLIEVINYIQKKVLTKVVLEPSYGEKIATEGLEKNLDNKSNNNFMPVDPESIQIGSADDLIKDISKSNGISFYNAQADVIFANAVDMSAINGG